MKLKLHKNNALIRSGFLTLLMLFAIEHLKAQSINTTVASSINNVFSPLEKNRVPYNILLDYGIEFIDISKYNGVLLSDNHTSMVMYKEVYNTLVSSATSTGVPGLLSPTLENAEWQTLQQQQNNSYKGSATAPIVLSGLYYNYSKIRSDALSTNKIQVINGKYDDKYINNVWQNPYESKIAFAITAPVQDIHQATVAVSLPATLWHTNETISNIAVDLGNGNGYKTLNSGATATETYTSVGMYTWTYRVQLGNGQYKYCRQKVNITVAATGGQARNSACSVQTIPIAATRSYLGTLGSATVQIAYGSSDCTLRKPLIVAEGLDTGFFGASGMIGDTDYSSFFTSIISSNSSNLRDLITNNTSIDYDVVYVNWDNGTDYLQRNAYVLQAVINYVNQQKAINGSTEPNVVLGQSMGGVIARYALRNMENRSENHDTGLYISHDAPHQGANAPLGFLYMARHAVDQFIRTPLGNIDIPVSSGNVGLGSVKDLLDAPAVKQMLINNVSSSFNLDNTLHAAWQNELKTMGYPQQTRNVALSNASHCASPQDISAGERIFTLDAFGKTSLLADLALSDTGLGAATGILASIMLDEAGFLLGILPGSSKFDIDFWVNAYPATGTVQIYYGRIKYKKTLLWLVPINVTITQRSYNSPSGALPFDSYPGGVNPSFADINISTFKSGLLGKYGFTVDLNPNFNFIPTTSALDVGSGNATLTTADYLKVYTKDNPPTGNKAIPFHNFTTSYNTSAINEPHITFNSRNGNWLANELNEVSNNIFNCSYTCANTMITGPENFCSSATFSVSLPPNTNVNWSVNPSNALNFAQGSPTTTFTRNNNFNGIATITLQVTSPNCDTNLSVSKSIEVGKVMPGSVSGTNGVCAGEDYYYYCNPPGGHKPWYTYRWTMPNSSWQIYSQIENRILAVPYGSNFAGQILAEVNNGCGWSVVGGIVAYPYCPGTYSYNVYPNPNSSGSFTVDIIDDIEKSKNKTVQVDSSNEQTNELAIEVYDFTGNVVKPKEIIQNRSRVDVSGLQSGLYILKIHHNGEIIEKKIIIEY